MPPEHHAGRGRCLLAALLLTAAAARADTGSDWFDAQIRAVQSALGDDTAAGSRVRYMACAFVAPALTAPAAQAGDGDGEFARMLQRLRENLRRQANP